MLLRLKYNKPNLLGIFKYPWALYLLQYFNEVLLKKGIIYINISKS